MDPRLDERDDPIRQYAKIFDTMPPMEIDQASELIDGWRRVLAAMCLRQDQLVRYQGAYASAFTDAFGKLGPAFVRGQTGQLRFVSKLRSKLR